MCSRPYERAPSICTQYPCSKEFLLILSLVTDACDAAETAAGKEFVTRLVSGLIVEESHAKEVVQPPPPSQKQHLRKVEEGHRNEELLSICACLYFDAHLFAGDVAKGFGALLLGHWCTFH